jgi:hypothetical protein
MSKARSLGLIRSGKQSSRLARLLFQEISIFMVRRVVLLVLSAAFSFVLLPMAHAQGVLGSLQGQVTDPTGAVVPQATVTATSATGQKASAVSDSQGQYTIKGLQPGQYTVQAQAKDLAFSKQPQITIAAGTSAKLDIALAVQGKQEEVQVTAEDEEVHVDTTPTNNASAIVIKGKDLDILSDDPDELQTDLEALAGPSAGPNGGQIYVDGFSNGQLPPKSAIREIRINQNPFSSEYDKLGYGRIEVFTKPGMDQYHGQFMVMGNDSALNSRNPLVQTMPAYDSEQYSGNFSGPLISKKASFFFNAERRNINDNAVVSAVDPASGLNFSEAVPSPRTRTTVSPRIDYQISQNNTLIARYQYTNTSQDNTGVGQFALPSQGYSNRNTTQSFQLSDTQVVSPTTINETHFQYTRDHENQLANEFDPSLQVLQAFTAGGNTIGSLSDHSDRYELQNTTSISHGNQMIKFGARFRDTREALDSTSGFNGSYTFHSTSDYQQALPFVGIESPQQIVGAFPGSQYTVTTGNPKVNVNWMDAGVFVQDDWKILPKLTLSGGLRFESQNDIHDHFDFAPRLGLAWAIGHSKNPKTVLRAGWGIFYDRFTESLAMQAEEFNGINQIQTTINNEAIQPGASGGAAGGVGGVSLLPTVYSIDPNLRAPYTMQTAVTLERQVSSKSTVALTYLNSRGEHQLMLRNINAPLPGSTLSSPVYPNGIAENLYQYESIGQFEQNQLIANINIRAKSFLTLFGFYSLNFANSDTSGPNSFPSNQYDVIADYGRASFDVRHRLFLGGTVSLPKNVRLNPFLIVSSGTPFNITLGRLNSASLFNSRPAFAPTGANCSDAGIVCTAYGNFDTNADAGPEIPINYGTGPGAITFNLRVSKTIGLGRRKVQVASADGPQGGPPPDHGGGHGGHGGGPGAAGAFISGPHGMFGPGSSDRRYSLTLSASARNLFNNVNYAAPVGTLTSPLFGVSNALAGGPFSSASANRRIELQALFSF